METIAGIVPDDLVQRFPNWRGVDPDFKLWSYHSAFCGLEQTLSAANLFWPSVVEYEGMVFIAMFFRDFLVDDLKQRFGPDKRRIERWVNGWELVDFFRGDEASGHPALEDDELVMTFGRALQFFWSLRLKTLFPERRFAVELGDDIESEDGWAITVYEIEN